MFRYLFKLLAFLAIIYYALHIFSKLLTMLRGTPPKEEPKKQKERPKYREGTTRIEYVPEKSGNLKYKKGDYLDVDYEEVK